MSAFGQTGTRSAAPSGQPPGSPPSTGQATGDPTQQGQPPEAPQRQQAQSPDGFWGRFPNVPEDQRAALEPHLKTVQAYVTRLEQAYAAPFRGMTPTQVKNVATFAKNFQSNPLQTFLGMAQTLQAAGVIHDDLDLQALAAVVQGQDPPDDGDEPIVDDGAGDPWETAPPWAQEMRAWKEQQEQQTQEQQRAEAHRREDAVFNHQVNAVKTKLKEAGYPETALSDKDITARFIVHNGSLEAVVQELTGIRTGILQGVMPNNENDDTVELPRGVPPTGKTALQRRADADKGDGFKKASAGAEQYLRQVARAAQQ